MSSVRLAARAVATVLAVVFLLGTAMRGVCLMATDRAAADAHDCCRDGLRAAPPPCCMTAADADPAARLTAAPALPVADEAALAPAFVDLRLMSRVTPSRWAAARLDHSPPPTLRI